MKLFQAIADCLDLQKSPSYIQFSNQIDLHWVKVKSVGHLKNWQVNSDEQISESATFPYSMITSIVE